MDVVGVKDDLGVIVRMKDNLKNKRRYMNNTFVRSKELSDIIDKFDTITDHITLSRLHADNHSNNKYTVWLDIDKGVLPISKCHVRIPERLFCRSCRYEKKKHAVHTGITTDHQIFLCLDCSLILHPNNSEITSGTICEFCNNYSGDHQELKLNTS
jgi:hypothetical protein